MYAWNKDRYWVPTSPLCYLAPGSTPIEMCDTSRTVTWAPTGDRAAALDGQGMLTVFAFPGGKAPEARSDHEVGREGVKYVWSGDGRSLLYATREGVWCATEGVEEDRPLNLSMAFYPHAALAGDCVVGLEPPARSGSESEWGRPWVVDWRGGDAFPLYPKPDAYCSSYKIAPACAGRALIVDFGRPLLFRVTPRQ